MRTELGDQQYQAEAANGVVGELRQKEQHDSTVNEKHIRG